MQKKYVLCPGEVTSKHDGQRHYIGPMQLARLYGVDQRECEIYEPAPSWTEWDFRRAEERSRGLVRLTPRYNGDYTVPNSNSPTNIVG